MGRSRSPRVDPIRVPGSRGTNSITSELESIRSQGPETGPFSRGVVFEVLGDLSQRSDEEVEALAASLTSGVQALRRAPRNSLIVQLTAGSSSTSIGTRHLCHPFFPPHLSMPIKPGEQVWVLFENPGSNNRYGYWICRVTEMDPVDDVNFTHPDRRFDLYVDKVQTETLSSVVGDDNGEETRPFDGLKDPNKVPGPPHFANGPIDDDNADPTLPILEEGDPSPYDQIYTGSISMQSVTLEPVPRFTKRPGDLVLQGSNNALICLGQDRGWTRDERPDSVEHSNAYVTLSGDGTAQEPIPDFCGTIDLVAGRGRFYENSQPNPDEAQIQDTQPRVIRNSRDRLEVDKNSASYTNDSQRSGIEWNRLDRPQEGDPDFLTDASRIYVSMRTSADMNFSITSEDLSPVFEDELEDIEESPFIVLKSDEIRIIARKEEDRESINGSIRLIKEGTVGEDAASIYLLPSGIIQVTGSKIYLGQADQGSGPGEAGSEPYVKYSELESLLEKWFDNINDFCQKMLTHTTPGYGSPSVQINQAVTTLQTETASRKQEIVNLKSERIFGE